MLNNRFTVSKKFSLGTELHFRNTSFITQKEQMLIRPYFTFKANQVVSYTAGYTYTMNFLKNKPNIPFSNEHNVWEQINLVQNQEKFSINHQLRLEQRFINNLIQENTLYKLYGYAFSNRFRYRFTFIFPFKESYYLSMFNETMIGFNSHFQNPDFDRNWMHIGLGYKFKKMVRIEFAYLHQTIKTGKKFFLVKPSLQINAFLNFDFSK